MFEITPKCLQMKTNDVWDVTKHLGNLQWPYIEPTVIFRKSKKIAWKIFFGAPKLILVRISLQNAHLWKYWGTKIIFSKNSCTKLKIRNHRFFWMCLECSELKNLSDNSKTERQVHFWSGLIFASFFAAESWFTHIKL